MRRIKDLIQGILFIPCLILALIFECLAFAALWIVDAEELVEDKPEKTEEYEEED